MRIYPSYDQMVQTHLQILEENPSAYFAQVAHDIQSAGYQTVRIHESGDFFTVQQIEGWAKLAVAMPTVAFYAYTRSWNQAALLPALEAFKTLPNVQVLASVEDGEKAPDSWRTATIVPKGTKAQSGAIVCPQQTGKVESCADCRFCIDGNKSKTQNVLFLKH